jgi:hypothetical protein
LGGRGYLYLSLSSTTVLSSSPTVQTDEKQTKALSLSLPPLIHLELPSNSIDFPINL